MKYPQIRKQREAKTSELIKECKMFFAFSNKQFEKGIKENPLDEGDKYFSICTGSYMPKSNVEKYKKGCNDINEWYDAIIKENNMDDEFILYELVNHEAFYTGKINDTYDALGGKYTNEKIWEVFNKNYDDYADC